VGFGSQVRDTMKGVLGLLPVLLSPAGRSRVLWLAGQLDITLSQERTPEMAVVMDDSTSGDDGWSTRVCLRVTKGTSEVDTTR
jgi:hypothetical protein